MLKIIILIPLLLSVMWFAFLQTRGYSLAQGKQGFLYILIFSGVIAAFYTLMLWLTH
jgi:hypothetical protein